MNRKIATLGALIFIVGCGAAADLPPDTTSSAASRSMLSQMVWNAESGAAVSAIQLVGNLGETKQITQVSDDRSTYMNGVVLIDIPDQESSSLQINVDVVGLHGSRLFRIFIQQGAEFVSAGQLTVSASENSGVLKADLSQFRGQTRLLALQVGTVDQAPLSNAIIWSSPQFVTP